MLNGDLQFFQSQNMTASDDGGGQMISVAIAQDQIGNLFPPVADVERTIGSVKGIKFYAGVNTHDGQTLYRGLLFVDKPPADPYVSVFLANTADWFDTWADARAYLESYLTAGVILGGRLLLKQNTGQRLIQLYQKPEYEIPAVGEVYVLVAHDGGSNEYSQYVRIIGESDQIQTFTLPSLSGPGYMDVQFRVITLTLDQALTADFDGGSPTLLSFQIPPAWVRETMVANAARVYGVAPLAQAAAIGDLAIQVGSILQQFVPSAQAEIPLNNLDAAGIATVLMSSGASYSYTVSTSLGANGVLNFGSSFYPGTLTINAAGATLTDDGQGNVVSGITTVGTCDYAAGTLTLAGTAPTYAAGFTVHIQPACAPAFNRQSAVIEVTQGNQGLNYVLTLEPPPTPNSLSISYRAQGKWYMLTEKGGRIAGANSAFGSGSYSALTATAAVTLGTVPDVGTCLIFSYGAQVSLFDRSAGAVNKVRWQVQGSHAGWAPGTVSITWPKPGGGNFTATDDSHGNLQGDATGIVRYAAGNCDFTPNALPLMNTTLTLNYQYGPPSTRQFDHVARGQDGMLSIDLTDPNIIAGSVEILYDVEVLDIDPYVVQQGMDMLSFTASTHQLRDNGSGGFSGQAGTINYAAGTLSFNPDFTTYVPVATFHNQIYYGAAKPYNQGFTSIFTGFQYFPTETVYTNGGVTIHYRTAGSSSAVQDNIALPAAQLDLTGYYAEAIVPGSAIFTLGGKTYYDRQGVLYMDFDHATGVGTAAGLLDYSTGVASLSAWNSGGANNPGLLALATQMGDGITSSSFFRIPSAPIRPGSLQLTATRQSGGQINITIPSPGHYTGTDADVAVDSENGIVRATFGNWVDPGGYENEPWYAAAHANMQGGQIWKPTWIYPNTLRYNAVALAYTPLSADRIGVNPDKFPAMGKVPVFDAGDLVVLHHTETTSIASPVTPGMAAAAGRNRLEQVQVFDANGTEIVAGSTTWAPNVDDVNGLTGVTFANAGLNLSAYTQPFTLRHRIADLREVMTLDISGQLNLNRPVSHVFPANASYVSAALEIGDRQARTTHLFTQATWLNHWLDALEGNAAVLQFDSANFPIQVWNDGAITENWVLILTSATVYKCLSQHLGLVAQGISINEAFQPTNPLTGKPYFKISAGAMGQGGNIGECVRFTTLACAHPAWAIQTIQPSDAAVQVDGFSIAFRGNAA